MESRKCSCAASDEHAELRSKAGASIFSSAAMVQASAGQLDCGEQLPEITRPISSGLMPAAAMACCAARAPVCALLYSEASMAWRGSALREIGRASCRERVCQYV